MVRCGTYLHGKTLGRALRTFEFELLDVIVACELLPPLLTTGFVEVREVKPVNKLAKSMTDFAQHVPSAVLSGVYRDRISLGCVSIAQIFNVGPNSMAGCVSSIDFHDASDREYTPLL